MLSKTCQYAIRDCIHIQYTSCEGTRAEVKNIAKEIDAPEAFTAKILQNLVRQNIVSSVKDKNGGFFLKPTQQKGPCLKLYWPLMGHRFKMIVC
jgi:Rrf2 family iron-sulfur cluster assembly transcriptional regulator